MSDDRPLLLLEDDISSWNPQTFADVPNDADIVRLGNSTYFYELSSVVAPHVNQIAYVNKDVSRTYGMFATHAIILISKRAKRALAESGYQVLENYDSAYDIHICSRTMIDLVTYTMNWPIFY